MAEIPVYFLLLPGYLLLDLAGPAEALRLAGRHGGRFCLRYIGPQADPPNSLGLAMGPVEPLPASLPDHAWLIVPGLSSAGASEGQAERRQAERWLAQVCRPQVRLITICSATLLAAGAGLLDGRHCTTHHALIGQLRERAPRARVEENRVFVIDRELASSAGITTGIDLILELIAESAGARVALEVAREMVVWLRRSGDSPQLSPMLSYRNHLHPAVHRVQDAISADPARDWSAADLARIACVTPRHLARLFQTNAGLTVTDYRQKMQLSLVEPLLAQRERSLEQIAAASGFASARDLRRVWARQRGMALRRG